MGVRAHIQPRCHIDLNYALLNYLCACFNLGIYCSTLGRWCGSGKKSFRTRKALRSGFPSLANYEARALSNGRSTEPKISFHIYNLLPDAIHRAADCYSLESTRARARNKRCVHSCRYAGPRSELNVVYDIQAKCYMTIARK